MSTVWHEPWKIAYGVSYGILFGLFIGRYTDIWSYISILVSAVTLAVLLKSNKQKVALLWILVLSLLLGIWRAQSYVGAGQELTSKIQTEVTVTGRIRENPTISMSGKALYSIDELMINNQKIPGRMIVQTSIVQELRRSDVVTVNGLLSSSRSATMTAMFNADLVEVQELSKNDPGLRIRDWFSSQVRRFVPEPHASLSLGFIVGEKGSLQEELTLDLRLTGLTHIVVASGFNLTILVILIRKFAHKISRYSAMLLGLGSIIMFVAVSGSGPSMVRAGFVTGLSLVAWYFGRKFMPSLLIGIVAAGTSFYYPEYVWGDVAWYLSFLAFSGVLILAPRLELFFFGDRPKGNIVRSALVESVSAVLLTLPYSLYIFGQLSVVALVANMLVVPIIPLAMLFTFLTGITTAILPVAGEIVAYITRSILQVVLYLVEFFAKKDPGYVIDSLPLWAMLTMYLALFIGYFYMHRATTRKYFEVDKNLDDL